MKDKLVIGIMAIALAACGGGGSSGGGTTSSSSSSSSSASSSGSSGFNYSALFANLADNIILPTYQEFDAELQATASAVTSWCGAIDGAEEASNLETARQAWRNAMAVWQKAELHNVGPSASQASLLRNQVYAYDSNPLNTCSTDRAVVLAEEDGFDIGSRIFGARGLDALEYMLFNDNLEHTCIESNDQTAPWNARSEVERKLARCAYAELLVADISAANSSIQQQWNDSYRDVFVNSAAEVILENVSDALFYIEKGTKDRKLGVPAGLHADCTALACPEAVEAPYADAALQNIAANLDAFETLFTGADGVGFDDIIAAANMESINTAFLQEIADARNYLQSLIDNSVSLASQSQAILDSGDATACVNSQANPDTVQTVEVCSLQGYIKRITDRLRTDFITIVGVDLPDSSQGDAD